MVVGGYLFFVFFFPWGGEQGEGWRSTWGIITKERRNNLDRLEKVILYINFTLCFFVLLLRECFMSRNDLSRSSFIVEFICCFQLLCWQDGKVGGGGESYK